jgi:hypothetical protein
LCRSLSAVLSGVALAKSEALAKADAFATLHLHHIEQLFLLTFLRKYVKIPASLPAP